MRTQSLKVLILEIPYFSTQVGVEGEAATYELDSVYGSNEIDIQIFRNNFFLSSFDANDVEQAAAYYSDLGSQVDAIKGDPIEFGDGTTKISNFVPSEEEVTITEVVDGESTVSERLSPRLSVELEPDILEGFACR